MTLEIMDSQTGKFRVLTSGVTNSDGRVTDLLPPTYALRKGKHGADEATAPQVWTTNKRGVCICVGAPPPVAVVSGIYQATFHTQQYFDAKRTATFYPFVTIV